jgi:hypothetical protein
MYETSEDRTRALLDSYIGELIAQDPSFKIGPRNPFKGMSPQDLQRGKDFDYQPDELQKYYDRINRPGPKLPLAYLRDDPALTPSEMNERNFIEYEKNRPMPGTVVDPQNLDLREYMIEGFEDDPRYDPTSEPIERLKYLLSERGPIASAAQPEYFRGPQIGELMSTIPSGPSTSLPAEGWNPSMTKPPGDPNYRPPAQYYYIGPRGEKIPFV